MERGRPRIFNEEEALDAALALFWRNGYLGTSMTELTNAMGISKPSLYAAFGNKEELYLLALKHYRQKYLTQHSDALAAEPDLRKALQIFLRSIVTMITSPELPGGCMVVNSATACDASGLPGRVIEALTETVDPTSFSLTKKRLQDELKQRHLPEGTSIEQLADYFATLMSGMAVMAKVGVSRERLFGIIDHALHVLPDTDKRK